MKTDSQLSNLQGLTGQEAQERLLRDGPNEIPSAKKRSIFAVAWEVVREPMFLLLVACGTLYLILGDMEEAFMLLGFVFVVMGITLYQERKTDRALDALRDLSSPRALVIRDGEQRRIPGRELVAGDVVLLAEGDRIPADSLLHACSNLSVDESLLTGESVPVPKSAASADIAMETPGGENVPFVFSGTMVVRGRGTAVVKATGIRTEIGKIGTALQSLESEDTPLKRKTAKLVRRFALVGVILCSVVVVTYGLTRGNWLDGMLAGLTLGMATLPEEFPVVLTIFLALGAWRISQRNVLTRRIPAVETLGSATVICTDKTGTLTMNQMTVSDLYTAGEYHVVEGAGKEMPPLFRDLVHYTVLASQENPFDPMEKAMRSLGERMLAGTEFQHNDWSLIKEYPLTRELLSMAMVWRVPAGGDCIVAVKGAPEAVAGLCHAGQQQVDEITAAVNALAAKGKRVIAVARARCQKKELPETQPGFGFEFLGLLGLEDPVRTGVKQAVQECYEAGIRTIMITGDYPGTAKNIAAQIGLKNPDDFISGKELEGMTDQELQQRIGTTNVFARMVPDQKLRLVNALKAKGEVVAMTGDGVNDAPALKAAHIGIGMGMRGTDVAREASALVLLDDDFGSIVAAIRMGRRIYDNLKKAMMYIFSVHIPIAGMSILPILLGWPLALLPIHIVFLELIIDPACSVVFEAETEEKNIMRRKPRREDEPLFGLSGVIIGLIQGLAVLCIVALLYSYMLKHAGEEAARATAFAAMVFGNLGLILTNRSWTRSIVATLRVPNKALWWVMGGAILFLLLATFIPFFAGLFRFAPMDLSHMALAVLSSVAGIAVSELLKLKWIRNLIHRKDELATA
jgi:Ca2+-transporting ATPase